MDEELEVSEEPVSAQNAGDGMPMGDEMTPLIQSTQVEINEDGSRDFDDDAAATIVWMDYQTAKNELEQASWLAEWQYVDYLYQSPTYDRDWRQQTNRPARISRFNIAKNRNTLSTAVRRSIFAQQIPFVLEPMGKLAEMADAQTYIDAWTAIFDALNKRADFEYNMSLFIECQVLQGTAMAVPVWETREVTRNVRRRKKPAVEVEQPLGGTKKINTWESDDFKVTPETVEESWPCFEYRRLGTTFYDPKWKTPNRPDLSAAYRVDVDYLTFEDLDNLRKNEAYKDIPSTEDLKKFFLQSPQGDAPEESAVALATNTQGSNVLHADGEHTDTSQDPFLKPLMKVARWDHMNVMEILVYEGRKKIIRNGAHGISSHALGYSATWWNIENSGYGMGVGRLNAGDQRMDQGVLNEVLKMIAYPMNAPLLYDTTEGNAPTQNVVAGLGTFWGINAPNGDIRKAVTWLNPPEIPQEAWKIYELGKSGGEDLVGANSATMQGNLPGPGSSIGRTATGAQRIASKADESLSDPIAHIEIVIERWLQFLWERVLEDMPLQEIRRILSDKYGEKILDTIDAETFMCAEFNIRVLAGQKLAHRVAVAQLIPFLLSLVQQPQLMQFMHEKGETINFSAIAKLYVEMSELQGRQDLIIPLTPQQQQSIAAMNPNAMKLQVMQAIEQLKNEGKLQAIDKENQGKLYNTIVDKLMDHAAGLQPLEQAQARTTRNEDADILQNGPPSM